MGGGPPPMPGSGQTHPEDADDSPDLIVAVVEVRSVKSADLAHKFNDNKIQLKFEHKWGKIDLQHKIPLTKKGDVLAEVTVLEKSKGARLPTVKERFHAREKEVLGSEDKNDTPKVVEKLARFALELGLVDECAKVMDKLAESDKNHPIVKAYVAVKADMDRPVGKFESAAKWQKNLLVDYAAAQNDNQHFALLHHPTKRAAADLKGHLDQLERTYRAYYYWWALRGVRLPVPQERQVCVLADTPEKFSQLQATLTASPPVADSFFARRELTSVFAGRRNDLPYAKIDKVANQEAFGIGFDRDDVLTGVPGRGAPKSLKGVQHREAASLVPRIYALVLKAMEYEYEQTSVTHEASRQLLFASRLLPRNVQVPEWIQFGMGSFFETPLQSPWPSIGAANPYWLPRFEELRKKGKYEPPSALLKKVVTDGHFRGKAKDEAALRKARAAAWSLTYYLARSSSEFPKLQRYFRELSKLPRDAALDEKTLWASFARAFDLNSEENVARLANNWLRYVQQETLDAAVIHDRIRRLYADMNAPPTTTKGGGGGGNTGGGSSPPGPIK